MLEKQIGDQGLALRVKGRIKKLSKPRKESPIVEDHLIDEIIAQARKDSARLNSHRATTEWRTLSQRNVEPPRSTSTFVGAKNPGQREVSNDEATSEVHIEENPEFREVASFAGRDAFSTPTGDDRRFAGIFDDLCEPSNQRDARTMTFELTNTTNVDEEHARAQNTLHLGKTDHKLTIELSLAEDGWQIESMVESGR